MNNNDKQHEDIHIKQLDVDVSPHANMLSLMLTVTQVTFDLDLTK